MWDLVRYARHHGIRYAGRGSAADSVVAYVLGITEVDAFRRGLLFERFLSPERGEKPDIDVDFDARHRDRMAAYVRRRYGEERVAGVATYQTYQARSALRDAGQALGFPPEELRRITARIPYYFSQDIPRAVAETPEIQALGIAPERWRLLVEAAQALIGRPRHLGTHLGGLVIADEDLASHLPLQSSAKGIPISQWDKEYLEDMGYVKFDLLSLRTLSVIEDTVRSLGLSPQAEQRLPLTEPETMEMIGRGETVGVFQLESAAQRALQVQLQPRTAEDIVHAVALIRPGPIKGDMVRPYLRRRAGKEPVRYLHPLLRPILEKTYGVVLFQEQVIEIATAVAGFTPGEADQLRRVMTHHRRAEEMAALGEMFLARAQQRGVSREEAAAIFRMIEGYASYGFCEAHAAAFATTALKTAYLVRHHPAEFFAALLSHQPAGYYPPHVLVTEARRRGVSLLPLDVHRSRWEFCVEEGAIRVGFCALRGLRREVAERLLAARPFASMEDFLAKVSPDPVSLEALVWSGALDSLDAHRRRLWLKVRGGQGGGLWRVDDLPAAEVDPATEWERAVQEWRLLGFEQSTPLFARLRPALRRQGISSSREIRSLRPGTYVEVAGWNVRPHRPPTRSGRRTVFLSLADEWGLTDVVVDEEVYRREGAVIFFTPSPPLRVAGWIQRKGQGVFLRARRISALGPDIREDPGRLPPVSS